MKIATLILLLTSTSLASELFVGTEFRYPTSYRIIPPTITTINGIVISSQAIIIPENFETRMIGTRISVDATATTFTYSKPIQPSRKTYLQELNQQLLVAATSGDYLTTYSLLYYGANPNTTNVHGSTPLMGASAGGFDKIVKLLLKNGANPKIKSKFGYTALDFALKNNHTTTIQLLQKAVQS